MRPGPATLLLVTPLLSAGRAPALPSAIVGDAPRATLTFASPRPLQGPDGDLDLGAATLPCAADVDGDGATDLLVGTGDGSLLVLTLGGGAVTNITPIDELGILPAWGRQSVGAALGDLVGSDEPDLVVACGDDRLRVYAGRREAGGRRFAAEAVEVALPPSAQGRFDLGDLDGDGALDLVVGSFGGPVAWLRGRGKAEGLGFEEPVPLEGVGEAYNSCPRVFDLEGDGDVDLLVGVNWGYLAVHRCEGEATSFGPRQLLQDAELGDSVHLRERLEDNSSPALVDLDGDGVLDLVSGGKNGTLWWLPGLGSAGHLGVVEQALAEANGALGEQLVADPALRGRVFGALRALQADLRLGLLSGAGERERLWRQLEALGARYPESLRRRRFDQERETFSAPLFAQYALVVKGCAEDTPKGRARVARALQEPPAYARLLVDHGVLFHDNARATPEHLERMGALLEVIPRGTWDVELISVADWIGPGARDQRVEARSGINIFGMRLGVAENSFPSDAVREGKTDVFLICLAHELAHNMLDTIGRRTRPDLFARKYAGLRRAAGDAVVWQDEVTRGYDREATRARFRAEGHWDGQDATWNEAWTRRFRGKDAFERAHLRGNVEFFLNAPQEAFSTLSNQWFADSRLMVRVAKDRFDAGFPACADQLLVIAEYLSQGGKRVPGYTLQPGGALATEPLGIRRDAQGRIRLLEAEGLRATFGYGEGDLVTAFDLQDRERE
ncbi:MAG: VCBS repeat-containing protein [Planctomycetota bacterium]|nr:VCBS repeat-containing protein [Planctomycetota bacterium]